MKTIDITFEKTIRNSKIIEVTDSVFEEMERTRRLPDDLYNKMTETVADPNGYCDVICNYAVVDMDNPEENVIDWDD